MAAYEAAKVVTRPGINEVLARTRCDEILNIRQVTNYTLTFSPTVTTAMASGSMLRDTTVCSAITRLAAATMGSVVCCGSAP